MSETRYWFITFTTYGTHFHGDGRGSVRRGRKGQPSQPLDPDDGVVRRARGLMAQDSFFLTEEQRATVATTISHLSEFKGWLLVAMNVRTNHVHLLVGATVDPDVVMNVCKSWATRRLRESGLVASDRRVWTRHGSTRSVDPGAMERVASYILEGQGVDLGGTVSGLFD